MPFSANYRRVRAPQHPFAKVTYRLALTVLLVCIICVLSYKITARGFGGWMSMAGEDGNEDISGSQFKFTNYRVGVNKSGTSFWRSIVPAFVCPRDLLTKVGVGGQAEKTGRWVCGLKNLAKLKSSKKKKGDKIMPPCVTYSFVYDEEPYFEDEILKKTNCSVFLYDPMRDAVGDPLRASALASSRVHFEKLTIGGEEKFDKRTLELLMELNGHKWIDILKIDVKVGEYMALERILNDFRSTMPFGQLIIKFYVPDWHRPQRGKWMAALFEILEKRGLRLFYITRDPYYSPCCATMSFINVKKMSMFLSQEDQDNQAAIVFNENSL